MVSRCDFNVLLTKTPMKVFHNDMVCFQSPGGDTSGQRSPRMSRVLEAQCLFPVHCFNSSIFETFLSYIGTT